VAAPLLPHPDPGGSEDSSSEREKRTTQAPLQGSKQSGQSWDILLSVRGLTL
jgi:hypothetical protein